MTTTEDQTPQFEHDCERCTFLGRQRYPRLGIISLGGEDLARACDVYYCTQGGRLPTVIFRFSDDGPDYYSGWHLRGHLKPDLAARLDSAAGRGG